MCSAPSGGLSRRAIGGVQGWKITPVKHEFRPAKALAE